MTMSKAIFGDIESVRSVAPTDAGPPADPPSIVIVPPSGWAPLELGEIWRFRDLLFALALRDIKLRYRQTLLGAAWVVLQPLMGAAIFAFVFGRVAKLPSGGGTSYFLFAYVGLTAWNLFSGTLTKAGGCLVGSTHLVSKVYFPRMVLPLSTLFGSVLDAVVSIGVLAAMMAFEHVTPGWPLLLAPLWIALLSMLALGLGLITAALMVQYRDVQYILPVFVQMLLYGSPVAYAAGAVPAGWQQWVALNPLTGLLEAFRWSFIGTPPPAAWVLGISLGACSACFLGGAFLFKRMERRFADVI